MVYCLTILYIFATIVIQVRDSSPIEVASVINFLKFSFCIWKHSSMCLECMVQCYCFQSTVSESKNYWEIYIKKVISALFDAVYIMKFLPETKGKNYVEILRLLS